MYKAVCCVVNFNETVLDVIYGHEWFFSAKIFLKFITLTPQLPEH
jgi:hypothetical protein